MVYPHDQQSRILNEFSAYLDHFPEITNATDTSQLPKVLQCPWVEMVDFTNNERRVVGNGETYWYTGYAYYAQLEDDPNWRDKAGTPYPQLGVVLKLNRNADKKGKRRGVLFGDNVAYFPLFQAWYYTHQRNSPVRANSFLGFWRTDTRAFRGQHLAWSDGSVEWVNATEMKLDVSNVTQTKRNASYSDAGYGYFWWY
jgi:hypothetical protein